MMTLRIESCRNYAPAVHQLTSQQAVTTYFCKVSCGRYLISLSPTGRELNKMDLKSSKLDLQIHKWAKGVKGQRNSWGRKREEVKDEKHIQREGGKKQKGGDGKGEHIRKLINDSLLLLSRTNTSRQWSMTTVCPVRPTFPHSSCGYLVVLALIPSLWD